MDNFSDGKILFLPEGVSVPLRSDESILSHSIRGGVPILSPCGGEGRCGKCRVMVSGNSTGGGDPGILNEDEVRAGIRLACRCFPVQGDLTVTVLPGSRPALLTAILSGGEGETGDASHPVTNLQQEEKLGVALDVGTTTLVGALVHLASGKVITRAAVENPQVVCGEDLISRIVFGEENRDGFDTLRSLQLQGIAEIFSRLLNITGGKGIISEVTAAGNTVGCHILFGLSPSPIRRPPYQPEAKHYPVTNGEELGFIEKHRSRWRVFPSIGGFVGGDIVSGILVSGMCDEDRISVLFDVGTNGEVVLGNREFTIACSSSAGPAFEGGEVACGMRAYPGAIDSVWIDKMSFSPNWTVINGIRPKGICGSGILDLCAELFKVGLVDRAGQFVPRIDAPFKEEKNRMVFEVVNADKSGDGTSINFTSTDLKSVLRTKAALCAAAHSLLEAVGLSLSAVERVYIAGGFGNFLDLRSALTLGLFLPLPLDKFVLLGNASLAGTIKTMHEPGSWERAMEIAAATSYHDLSTDPNFMEAYQRALFIPHTDEEMYRDVLAKEAEQ